MVIRETDRNWRMKYYVYIVGNQQRNQFFVGITNDLQIRVMEHRHGMVGPYFKSGCAELLYYEEFRFMEKAMGRSFQLQNWTNESIRKFIDSKSPGMPELILNWGAPHQKNKILKKVKY